VLKPSRDGMHFYALAFTAYALVDDGRLDDLTRVVEAMRRPQYQQQFGTPSVILYGHELLARSGALRAGDERHRDRARDLALKLAAAVPHGKLVPSMAHLPRKRWPADNEVGFAALTVAATLFTDREIAAARDRLRATLDALGTLPPSEIDPKTNQRRVPRSCALGWSVIMRGLHDPVTARAMYARFKEEHFAGIGFREWPRGVDGPADTDSGAIIWRWERRKRTASWLARSCATAVGRSPGLLALTLELERP
jgi:hypothetical protein